MEWSDVRYILLHAGAHARQMLRTPAYWITAMAFPLAFFLLFGIMYANLMAEQGRGAEYAITPFILFCTLNVTLTTLAARVAADRESPWENRMRLLPITAASRFAGRLLFIFGFNLVSWIPLLVVASLITDVQLRPVQWVFWLAAVVVGAIPFGLLGIAIGYLVSPQTAMGISSILFLALSFLGGLFIPATILPTVVQRVVPFVPSQEYLQFVYRVIGYGDGNVGPGWTVMLLIGWGVAFAVLALVAYRRDEGIRYG